MKSILGIVATIVSVFITVHLPKEYIIFYTGILKIFVEFILFHKKKFKFSWIELGFITFSLIFK